MPLRQFYERWTSKRWVSLSLQALLLVSFLVAVAAYQTRKHLRAGVAPDFQLRALSGERVSLSSFRHKKVLLHFFATWCGVCRAELPSVRGVARNLQPDEVLLAIVEDADDLEAVRRYASDHDLTYPILLGTPEAIRGYRVNAFPTNYFINGDGTISSSTVGLSTRIGMTLRLWLTTSDSNP